MYTQRDVFFDIVRGYFTDLLIKSGIAAQELRRINASHVNFVFECEIDNRSTVLKANFYGRSMLFAYEKFLNEGVLVFSARLREYGEKDDRFDMLLEKQALNLLAKHGVNTPVIRGFMYPHVLLLEKLQGRTLDKVSLSTTLSKMVVSSLVTIHSIPAPLGCRIREVEIRANIIVIKDPNFGKPMLFDGVARNVTTAISSHVGQKYLLHGDFKGSNIIFDGEKISIIDPKMCIGMPHADLGKFATRSILTTPRRNLLATKTCLELIFGEYSQIFNLNVKETEQVSIVFGIMELSHLLARKPRPNLEILGNEMPKLYQLKPLVIHLTELILRRGKMMTISELCSFVESWK